VSLNTFIFSSFVLVLIIYNNTYTQYKIMELNHFWIYMFFASFIFMQLIECFIWRNINNAYYNKMFSIMALLLIAIQPVISMMLIPKQQIRNILLSIYLLLSIPYIVYVLLSNRIYSLVSKNGHLSWKFIDSTLITWIIWLFFFLFSFMYGRVIGIIFGLITLLISYFNYRNGGTVGSMWCWAVNSVMIYYAFYLLILLPLNN
jgi:hypothetical protein